jgi:hypothetical protein
MATHEELLQREDVKKIVADLSAQNPGKRFRPIDTPAGLIVICNPTRAQWNIMRAIAWDEDKANASKSMEGLILGIIKYPDAAAVAKMSEDFVGLWDNPDVVREVRRHCGHAAELHAK